MNLRDYIVKLKAALMEAAQVVEHGAIYDRHLLLKKAAEYRALANEQAPLVDGTPDAMHRQAPLQRYVQQLEDVVKKVLADGGPRASEASLVLSSTNLKTIGLVEDRPITGVFDLDAIMKGGKPTKTRIMPRLDERCPHPDRNGRHETYMEGKRMYCRACGAEGRWT